MNVEVYFLLSLNQFYLGLLCIVDINWHGAFLGKT
jgi:hypothetical protein